MQRKKFLLTTLTAIPAVVFGTAPVRSDTPPFKVDAGKSRFGEKLTFRGINEQNIKVSNRDTGKTFSVLEYVGKEKAGPPLHIHFDQDEIFYIAEGEYRFIVGDTEIFAAQGDTVFLPRNIPHTWIQLSEHGRQIYMLQPAGSFEEFLRELEGWKTPPDDKELQRIHLKHGMKVLGPPLKLVN